MVLEWKPLGQKAGLTGATLDSPLRGEDIRSDSLFLQDVRRQLTTHHELSIPIDTKDPALFLRLIDRLQWHNAARDGSSKLAHDDNKPLLLRVLHDYSGRTLATLSYPTARTAYLAAKDVFAKPELQTGILNKDCVDAAIAALEIAGSIGEIRAAVRGVNRLFYQFGIDPKVGGFQRAADETVETAFLETFRAAAEQIGVRHHPLRTDQLLALSEDKIAHMVGRNGQFREGILRTIAKPESEQ